MIYKLLKRGTHKHREIYSLFCTYAIYWNTVTVAYQGNTTPKKVRPLHFLAIPFKIRVTISTMTLLILVRMILLFVRQHSNSQQSNSLRAWSQGPSVKKERKIKKNWSEKDFQHHGACAGRLPPPTTTLFWYNLKSYLPYLKTWAPAYMAFVFFFLFLSLC